MATYCATLLTDTLMAWDDSLGAHLQSGNRPCAYYFRIPDAWAKAPEDELQQHILTVARAMYADLNERFRAAQPDDPNYMMVIATNSSVLSADDAAAKPWLTAPDPAAWESTPCVAVRDDGSYLKVARDEF